MLEHDFVTLLVSIIEGMILKSKCQNTHDTDNRYYSQLIESLDRDEEKLREVVREMIRVS